MVAAAGKGNRTRCDVQPLSGTQLFKEEKDGRTARPRGIKTAVGAVQVEDTGSAISD